MADAKPLLYSTVKRSSPKSTSWISGYFPSFLFGRMQFYFIIIGFCFVWQVFILLELIKSWSNSIERFRASKWHFDLFKKQRKTQRFVIIFVQVDELNLVRERPDSSMVAVVHIRTLVELLVGSDIVADHHPSACKAKHWLKNATNASRSGLLTLGPCHCIGHREDLQNVHDVANRNLHNIQLADRAMFDDVRSSFGVYSLGRCNFQIKSWIWIINLRNECFGKGNAWGFKGFFSDSHEWNWNYIGW